jgi:hypothetical protein
MEAMPTLAVFSAFMLWLLIPDLFNVDLRFIELVGQLEGLNYQLYNLFQELSSLILFGLVAWLGAARIRSMYRRGLRFSWGFFPFPFLLRHHWLESPKPDASSIA